MTLKETYEAYLLSDHWKGLRAEAFARAGKKCEVCSSKKSLCGHHLVYRTPLETCTPDDIMALCSRCHDLWHEWLKHVRRKVFDFCRQSTRGGFLVLLNPLVPAAVPATPAAHYFSPATSVSKRAQSKAQRRVEKTLSKSTDLNAAIKTLDRESFKTFLAIFFTGKKKNSQRASAMIRYDRAHPERLKEKQQENIEHHKALEEKRAAKVAQPPAPEKVTKLDQRLEKRAKLLSHPEFKRAFETFPRNEFNRFLREWAATRHQDYGGWNSLMSCGMALFDSANKGRKYGVPDPLLPRPKMPKPIPEPIPEGVDAPF